MKLRLIALFLLPVSLFAATLRVNNTPGTSPDFASIRDAIAAAADGDTILIEGSTTTYEGFELSNKRLNLIGPGYALATNLGTPANKLSAVISESVTMNSPADASPSPNGSLIMGLEFRGDLTLIGCRNVTIARCLFGENAILRLYGPSNVVSQSFFRGHDAIRFDHEKSSDNRIENCLLPLMHLNVNAPSWPHAATVACYLRNNLIKNILPTSAPLVVENNILAGAIEPGFSASTFKNNIVAQSIDATTTGSGNIPAVSLPGIMTGYVFGLPLNDSAYVLSPLTAENTAFNAGTDGTHIGPFGGANPYVLSGVPPLPSIDELSVPTFAAPGADVTIRIKVSNRP